MNALQYVLNLKDKPHPISGIQDFEIRSGLTQGEFWKWKYDPNCVGLPFQKVPLPFLDNLERELARREKQRGTEFHQLHAMLTNHSSPAASVRAWQASEARQARNGKRRPPGINWFQKTPSRTPPWADQPSRPFDPVVIDETDDLQY